MSTADCCCHWIKHRILGDLKFLHTEIHGTFVKSKMNMYQDNAVQTMTQNNVQRWDELMAVGVKCEALSSQKTRGWPAQMPGLGVSGMLL
jgi:hypothetical protein